MKRLVRRLFFHIPQLTTHAKYSCADSRPRLSIRAQLDLEPQQMSVIPRGLIARNLPCDVILSSLIARNPQRVVIPSGLIARNPPCVVIPSGLIARNLPCDVIPSGLIARNLLLPFSCQ
jgi:hypothetical protein